MTATEAARTDASLEGFSRRALQAASREIGKDLIAAGIRRDRETQETLRAARLRIDEELLARDLDGRDPRPVRSRGFDL